MLIVCSLNIDPTKFVMLSGINLVMYSSVPVIKCLMPVLTMEPISSGNIGIRYNHLLIVELIIDLDYIFITITILTNTCASIR